MTIEQKLRDEYRIGFLDGFADGYEESYKESYEEIIRKAIIAVKGLLEPAVIAACYKLPLEYVIDILNQDQAKEVGTA